MATTHGEENNSLEWTPPKGATHTRRERKSLVEEEELHRTRRREAWVTHAHTHNTPQLSTTSSSERRKVNRYAINPRRREGFENKVDSNRIPPWVSRSPGTRRHQSKIEASGAGEECDGVTMKASLPNPSG